MATTSLAPNPAWVSRMQKLKAANDPALDNLFKVADSNLTGTYGYIDIGQWSAIAYKITGDTRYARAAITQLLAVIPSLTKQEDYVMQNMAVFALFYDWLKSEMTDTEDAAYQAGLMNAVTWCRNSKWRFPDSDLLLGMYLGMEFCGIVLGFDPAAQTYTLSTGETVSWSDIKQAVSDYFTNNSAGGVLDYSSEYNLNVLQFILPAVAFTPGLIPSLEALLPALCQGHAYEMNPDRATSHDWGDCQVDTQVAKGVDITLYRRLSCYVGLLGVTPQSPDTAALAQTTATLINNDFTKLHGGGEWRWLLYYDPAKLVTSSVPKMSGFYAPGVGVLRVRDGSSAVHILGWPRHHVDHESDFMNDVEWYSGGKWLLRHPIGYGANFRSPYTVNSAAMVGLGSMDDRTVIAQGITPTYAYLTTRTQGCRYPSSYYHPPQAFGQMTRTVMYLFGSNTLVTVDDYQINLDPRKQADFIRYRVADQTIMNAALGLEETIFHMPTTPTLNGRRFIWQASANGPTMQGVVVNQIAPTFVVPVTAPDFQLRIVGNVLGAYTLITAVRPNNIPSASPGPQGNQFIVDGVCYTLDKNTGAITP